MVRPHHLPPFQRAPPSARQIFSFIQISFRPPGLTFCSADFLCAGNVTGNRISMTDTAMNKDAGLMDDEQSRAESKPNEPSPKSAVEARRRGAAPTDPLALFEHGPRTSNCRPGPNARRWRTSTPSRLHPLHHCALAARRQLEPCSDSVCCLLPAAACSVRRRDHPHTVSNCPTP